MGPRRLVGKQLFGAHDARVVDEHVERRERGDGLGGKRPDGFGALDVENQRLHARVGGRGYVEQALAAAGDDDLVIQGVKGFSQAAADA
jgi:hypothetical protein